MDAIVVDGLRKRYGEVQALDGVSFRVKEGEVFGLLGPNGAGKSTTTRILVTLTEPDEGRAEAAGDDPARAARRAAEWAGGGARGRTAPERGRPGGGRGPPDGRRGARGSPRRVGGRAGGGARGGGGATSGVRSGGSRRAIL